MNRVDPKMIHVGRDRHMFTNLGRLLALAGLGGRYTDAPGQKVDKPKRQPGPGVGTNRNRRAAQGKNW